MRWDPAPIPDDALSFLTGMCTISTGGDVLTQKGFAIHVYIITASMADEYFYNVEAETRINDHLKAELRVRIFSGGNDADEFSFPIRSDDYIQLRLAYYF